MTPRVLVMGDEVRTEENFFRWTITINSFTGRSLSARLQGSLRLLRRQCCLLMAEDPEASALTARRAAQHVRLSSADDAYEHLCIF